MKKLITILILATASLATAQEFWSGANEKDWKNKNKDGIHMLVWVLNPQTTNEYTDGTNTWYVTNYTHTAENTNNILNGCNFSLTNSAGENCFEHGYIVQKCGGFDIMPRLTVYTNWAGNNKKWTVVYDVDRDEFRDIMQTSDSTNRWYTNSIPYVDDIKKVNERKSEYQKEKKK